MCSRSRALEAGHWLREGDRDFLLRDATELAGRLRPGTYRFDEDRSSVYLPMTMNFPENTEIEVELTFVRQPSVSGEPGPDDVPQSRASQSGIQGCGPARHLAATTVVLPEAQGAIGEIRALSLHVAVGAVRPHVSCADDQVPSVGEGVIPIESRMREIRTSGSTGRGWKRTYGSRTWHRRESKAEEIHTVPLV